MRGAFALLLATIVVGCSAAPPTATPPGLSEATPEVELTGVLQPSPAPPTHTPNPTSTPEATSTSSTSNTPTPTNTATPNYTAAHTPTPTPTPTATKSPFPTPTRTPRPTRTPTVTPMPNPVGEVTTEVLNLRSGPDTSYGIVGMLLKGDLLTVLGQTPDGVWLSIIAPHGTRGWVHGDWVDLATGREGIPVTDRLPPGPTP